MSSRIRILHIVGSMNMGGVQSFLMELLRNIDKERFEFLFLCHGEQTWDHSQEVHQLDGKIINIPSPSTIGMFKYIQEVRSVIRDHDVNIMHAHLYLGSSISLLAGALEHIPVRIMHSHSTRTELGVKFSRKLYVNLTRSCITALTTLRMACGLDAGKAFFRNRNFQLINNGIDIPKFQFDPSKRTAKRNSLNVSDTTPVFMHIGRFVEVKNHYFLIKIFAEYLTFHPHAILLLIGDGPTQQKITKLVKELEISTHVHFLGLREDVADFYSAADLLLLPSISEGLPLTLLESQANGLPALVSTGVPAEAQVLKSLIHFKSLQDPIEDWSSSMHHLAFKRNTGGPKALREDGYDSKDTAILISKIYETELSN